MIDKDRRKILRTRGEAKLGTPDSPLRRGKRAYRAFREFARLEASAGLLLMAAAIFALIWANSPWSDQYFDLWHIPFSLQFGPYTTSHDLHWWINEGLMVVFFFVVGLAIKREIMVGELSSLRQAFLPVAAAIGGMVFPAGLYLLINSGTEGVRGWGVPMATDIAFALGVMALVGSRIPLGLKIFLTALAIVDDIGAVLVIALFYSEGIVWLNLALAGGFLSLAILANITGARSPFVYAVLGIGLWLAFLGSGLHATLAGILMALTIPARGKIQAEEFLNRASGFLHDFRHGGKTEKRMLSLEHQETLQCLEDAAQEIQTPLQRMEHALHPWVTYGIIPLFALANAGISLSGDIPSRLLDRVSLGVIVGLIIGKQLGVTLAAWLSVKLKLADLPEGVTWWQIYGVGWLSGIGFTMSLFVTGLAFVNDQNLEAAKIGIISASLIAGIIGYLILRVNSQENQEEDAA